MKRSQVDPGAWAGPVVGTPGPGTSGKWSETGTYMVLWPSLDNVVWSPVVTPKKQNPVGLPLVCSWASQPALEGVNQTHLPTKG